MTHQIRQLFSKPSYRFAQTVAFGYFALTIGLGIVMLTTSMPVHAQQNLPIMGEPADAALSPLEEQRLGAQFMRQIRRSLPLIRDVQTTEYIQQLGDRLVAASGKGNTEDFTFFIINDPSINAFAIPGGYIGVNTGLISAMAEVEQLSSVLAHEIAHVTQRHHARSFATSSRSGWTTAAAVLAAIVISQASPQAGQAALAAGLAATQQTAINFTRSNEVEADRIGIEILASANLDTRAMAETFDILRRQNSVNTSGLVLEYLRTHPLDVNRIAEAADRASQNPIKKRLNSLDFQLFKARLEVLTSRDLAQTKRQYQSSNQDKNSRAQHAYAVAMLAEIDSDIAQGQKTLEPLDNATLNNPFFVLLSADINAFKRPKETDNRLSALAELYPERYSIIEKHIQFLIATQRLGDASKLAIRYVRTAAKPNPQAWMQLANIQQKLGDSSGSHESLARYFEALNEPGRASSQLQLAINEVRTGSQDEIRLSASLKLLQQKAANSR